MKKGKILYKSGRVSACVAEAVDAPPDGKRHICIENSEDRSMLGVFLSVDDIPDLLEVVRQLRTYEAKQ